MKYYKSTNYHDLEDYPREWLATVKRNGVFAETDNDCILTSRNDNQFPGFEHISAEIKHLLESTGFDFVQGELFSDEMSIGVIQGLARSKNAIPPEKQMLSFYIFNAGGKFKSTKDMFHKIKKAIGFHNYKYLKFVDYKIFSDEEVGDYLKVVNKDFEGLVLRHGDMNTDRRVGFVKMKSFKESDFIVQSIFEGNGKNKGRATSVGITGRLKGHPIHCKVPVHAPELQRRLWALRDNTEAITIEVSYTGIIGKSDFIVYTLRDASIIKIKSM